MKKKTPNFTASTYTIYILALNYLVNQFYCKMCFKLNGKFDFYDWQHSDCSHLYFMYLNIAFYVYDCAHVIAMSLIGTHDINAFSLQADIMMSIKKP